MPQLAETGILACEEHRIPVNGPKSPVSMNQQLYAEHQQSPKPEAALSMGGAGPGVGAGQREEGWLQIRGGCSVSQGRWVAWHPGSACAAPCSDLPSHGPPHTFQAMPTPCLLSVPLPVSFPGLCQQPTATLASDANRGVLPLPGIFVPQVRGGDPRPTCYAVPVEPHPCAIPASPRPRSVACMPGSPYGLTCPSCLLAVTHPSLN